MRRNVVAAGMCVAAALAVAGSAVQVAAASPGGADPHAGAGARRAGLAASGPRDTGMITGVVLGTSGRPLAGACITATLEAGMAAEASPAVPAGGAGSTTARTSAGGQYFFGGLKPGGYSLRYRACAHPAGPAGATGRAVVSGGQLVRVVPVTLRQPRRPGAAPRSGWAIPADAGIVPRAGRRLTLASPRELGPRSGYGGISGRVTDPAGRPIEGICVMVHVRRQRGYFGVGTSAQGTYSFASYLRAGQYTVQFGSCGPGGPAGNWAPQWYRGKYSQARADLIRVRAGKVTRGIDAVMRRGGTISGVVTGRGGARLSRVCVSAVTPDGKVLVAQARTVRGRYRIDALDAGRYRVYVDPACGSHPTPYLGQWWPGAATLKASKLVTVRLGAVTAHVNAALRVGGTIAGTVRLKNSDGKPLAGICVFGSGLGAVSSVQPDAVTAKNGSFVLEGLPAGRYQLSFGAVGCGNNGNYLYYNYPHPVQVGLGRTVHVPVFMQPGAIISGTVTSAATGLPLAGICVYINDFDGDFGVTRADGTFRIDQIRPGRYSVGFSGGCGNQGSYAPQWFPGRTQSLNAALVTFQGGKVTSGINAAMRPGSGISGVVTSRAGVPLGRICIGAFTPHDAGAFFGSGFRFYDTQTHHGAYQIQNLAPGQYQVVFFSCPFASGPGWAPQWYRSRPGPGSAGLLDVPAATTVTGVNAALARGGSISGTAMEPSGYADSFFCIFATNRTSGTTVEEDAGANPSGYPAPYSITGLAPGRYTVEFYACDNNGFAPQWYNRKSSPRTANPVTVTPGHVTGHISALLTKPPGGGGSISGRVTDHATGKPARGICVAASSPSVLRSGRTDGRGDYTVRHLATGSYHLYVYDCRGDRYATQARPGVIRVQAPNAVRGVNFAVVLAGSISGAVAGGSPTPAPRPGVCVTTVPMAGGLPGYAVTGRGGRYLISGLAPGRYHVYFDPVGCDYGALPFAPQWYSGQASRATATPVTVTAGGDTTGINATLARDGTISGTVTGPAPASAPLTGICVQATPAGALARSGSPVYAVSQSGSYTLARLPPGQYLVSFTSGCGASGYAAQWWQDANSKATATVVTVAPGSATNGIDAAMHS